MYKIPANTLFMGQQLVFMSECHSTNSEVQHLLGENSAEGVVVITNNQTRGRGQQGNTWESKPDMNLTFSIGLRPHFLEAKDHFYLSMAVSLGLYDWLCRMMPDTAIHVKWPNDLMANKRKICGILIENQVQGNRIVQSIVGIGLNVNQRSFMLQTATSMSLCTGKEFPLDPLLTNVLEHLEARYLQLRAGEQARILQQYEHALFWRHEEHVFSASGRVFLGTITGIDADGRLIIQTESGIKAFGFKEVAYHK